MIFNKTENQEREYLQIIINRIKVQINYTDKSVKDHIDTLQEYKEYLWSNKDIDPHEIRSMRESILNHFAIGENVIDKRKRMAKMLDIPYFGRIDFHKSGNKKNILPVYIGIHTFYDPILKKNLIYDWRAPISGMFYDNKPGQLSYTSPRGEVKGNISLKRQYRIREGKMEFMIESSLTIHDDILQKELSMNADDKMKNIVATIQKEQNQIIRNEDASVLIIQGVAGSGKTSIALHRIAYLLYTMKGNVSSKDLLIISPNKVFADYISNVLPELGEEMVPEISMEEILSYILYNKYKFQNFFEQVNELLEKPSPGFIDRIQYKSSFDFITELDRFLLHVENTYFKAIDVQLTKQVNLPAEFIEEQFRRFNRYPVRKRYEIMTDYILEIVQIQYRIAISSSERNLLKKEIKKMFAGNNDIQVYNDFFNWTGKPEKFKMRKGRTLEFADLAPLAYIHIVLEGYNQPKLVKHLLIDEMQDYSPIQYKVIGKLYPCKKTILGDANQSVNPYSSSTAFMIQKVFRNGEIMKLCKSYRSSYEITDFAQKIRMNPELEHVIRHGEKTQLLGFSDENTEIAGIIQLINSFRRSNRQSLGIICKTESQAKGVYEKLRIFIKELNFLSNHSYTFVLGTVVTSAHMAKGLEFDEVIIPQANNENYILEVDRSMLYIAVTRAMHKLTLTFCGKMSHFINT